MKVFTKMVVGFFASAFVVNVWAAATLFDPTIFERDIIDIGFDDIELIKSDLRLAPNDSVVVKHVLTPGEKRASCENVVLEIKQLEGITPKLNAYEMFNAERPAVLTDEQVNSLTKLLTNHKDTQWLNDRNTKKYIQIVLMKNGKTNGNTTKNGSVQNESANPMNGTNQNSSQNGKNKTYSALTVKDAKKLVDWAIKNGKIVDKDHNLKTAQ